MESDTSPDATTILTQSLDTVGLDAGNFDAPAARRRALDNLLYSLSKDELFYLRRQIEKIPTTRDPCKHLNEHILVIIAKFIDLEDFINLPHVSRTWKKVWKSEKIALVIIEREFPVKFANYRDLVGIEKKSYAANLCEQLRTDIGCRLSRRRGYFHSRMDLSSYLDTLPAEEDPSFRSSYQYHNGRLARPITEKKSMKVDSLFTGVSTIYADPDRQYIEECVLGDQLLVGFVGYRRNKLRMWSLDSDYTEAITLPSAHSNRYPTFSVHRNSVGFSKGSTFHIWTKRKPVKTFEYPWSESPKADPVESLQLPPFFHSINDEHFFLPHFSWEKNEDTGTDGVLRLTVLEYVRNERKCEYCFDVPMQPEPGYRPYTPTHWSITGDGDYTIIWAHRTSYGPVLCPSHFDDESAPDNWVSELAFNMFNKKFSLRHYLCGLNDRLNQWDEVIPYVWRGQMILHNGVESERGIEFNSLKAVAYCENTHEHTGVSYTYETRGDSVVRLKKPRDDSFIDYEWFRDPNNRMQLYRIQGDDDFVVICGEELPVIYSFLTSDEFNARRAIEMERIQMLSEDGVGWA